MAATPATAVPAAMVHVLIIIVVVIVIAVVRVPVPIPIASTRWRRGTHASQGRRTCPARSSGRQEWRRQTHERREGCRQEWQWIWHVQQW